MKYKTISQRENITCPNISKIIDYIERNWKDVSVCYSESDINNISFKIDNKFLFIFNTQDNIIYICKFEDFKEWNQLLVQRFDVFISMQIKIFTENLVWMYWSIKNFK